LPGIGQDQVLDPYMEVMPFASVFRLLFARANCLVPLWLNDAASSS
jgi:hypothetical protein